MKKENKNVIFFVIIIFWLGVGVAWCVSVWVGA